MFLLVFNYSFIIKFVYMMKDMYIYYFSLFSTKLNQSQSNLNQSNLNQSNLNQSKLHQINLNKSNA